MKKSNVTEVKEIKKLAEQILAKEVLSTKDLQVLNSKLDTVLAQFGVFKKYFKRLL